MSTFLKVVEVAKTLGVSNRTVYNRIESGEIPSLRIGKKDSKRPTLRIPRVGFEEFLQKNTRGTA